MNHTLTNCLRDFENTSYNRNSDSNKWIQLAKVLAETWLERMEFIHISEVLLY